MRIDEEGVEWPETEEEFKTEIARLDENIHSAMLRISSYDPGSAERTQEEIEAWISDHKPENVRRIQEKIDAWQKRQDKVLDLLVAYYKK